MVEVRVVESAKRRFYRMYYVDPITDRRIYRSTGVEPPDRRSAEVVAAKWETELSIKGVGCNADPSWRVCRERFEDEYCPNVKPGTEARYLGTLNSFERIMGTPERISRVTASMLSKYAGELRRKDYAEAGIAAKLRDLKVFLRWLARLKLIAETPHFPKIKQAKAKRSRAKGRALSGPEFEKMKKVIAEVVPASEVTHWVNLLDCLWLSGLRLGEAAYLRWDADGESISIDYSGTYPMLDIPEGAQKSGVSQLSPITPDFAEFLKGVPHEDDLLFPIACTERDKTVYLSKKITKAGKLAGIVVKQSTGKYASAHDLRRSFGTRWAIKLQPQALQELMRHASIETTMTYYANDLAEQVAAEIWGK